jgi:hypothetical protein
MQTQAYPSSDGTDCDDTRLQPTVLFDRAAGAGTCMICRGPLADHTTAEHASRVVDRLAALGYPTPVNIGMP